MSPFIANLYKAYFLKIQSINVYIQCQSENRGSFAILLDIIGEGQRKDGTVLRVGLKRKGLI